MPLSPRIPGVWMGLEGWWHNKTVRFQGAWLTCLPNSRGIHSKVSINTLNQYPRSTSQLILNWHLNQYLPVGDSWLTLDQQSVHSQFIGDWLICINQNSVIFQPTVKWDEWIECQLSVNWDVSRVLIKVESGINWGYQFTLDHRCLYCMWLKYSLVYSSH